MAFKAAKTVMALEYDFHPFLEVKGVTPEPSADAVRHFLYESQRILRENFANEEASTDEDFVRRTSDLTEEDYDRVSDQILDLVGELTQGQPSLEEIKSLPHRIQKAYVQWLRKELTDPEAPSGATKSSQARRLSVAPTMPPAGS